MNNQPLPKPSQSNNNNNPQKGGGNTAPPPSALNQNSNSSPNKKGVVFDGDSNKNGGNTANSRIPLAQKPVGDTASGSISTPVPVGKAPVGEEPLGKASSPGVKLPPTSLSALSSMSSNKIPGDKPKLEKPISPQTSGSQQTAVSPKPSTSMQAPSSPQADSASGVPKPGTKPGVKPGLNNNKKLMDIKTSSKPSVQPTEKVEKTVLGAPIPQTIRGEALPKGLGSSPKAAAPASTPPTSPSEAPTSSSSPSGPATPVSKLPASDKTVPVPVAPGNGDKDDNKKGAPKDGEKPKLAVEKKSILKFLPFIVGGIAILVLVGFVISKIFGGGSATPLPSDSSTNTTGNSETPVKRTEVPAEQKEIVYWGLWEPNEVMEGIISDFEAANPGVEVTYVKQSHNDYRERLQTALDSGSGPDVFRFHASWTPILKSNLYPIPSSVVSSKEFKDNYYPIVTEQLVSGGQYLGVPLMYDGLALYYNEDILDSASETPPSTWADLRLLAAKLTVKSANGIERAGLAIGSTSNVDHFADILAILMLQNGADFSDPNSQETKDAMLFYTNFVLKDEVWDETLPSSTVAFARGDVAMMFAPSWRAHEVAAQNPNLRFKTMTLPQLSDERVSLGSYWAEGINEDSKNKDVASEFLAFLSSDENLMKLFSKASEVRAFGEIYPKVSMAEKLVNNDVVAAYLDDALYAQSWYMNSFTHDNGINDQMIEYYKDGLNALLEGEDIEEILVTIEDGTKQVLKQYGVSSR